MRQVLHLIGVFAPLRGHVVLRLLRLGHLILQHLYHVHRALHLAHQRRHLRGVLATLRFEHLLDGALDGGVRTRSCLLLPIILALRVNRRELRFGRLGARHLRAQLLGQRLARLGGGDLLLRVDAHHVAHLAELVRRPLAQIQRLTPRALRLLQLLLMQPQLRVQVLGQLDGLLTLALGLRQRLK